MYSNDWISNKYVKKSDDLYANVIGHNLILILIFFFFFRIQDMEALREKIRTRDERIQEEQEQKEKDRIEAAREKNRDREEKLSCVKAAEQDMKEKRQEKILQKQEDAAKR